MIAYSYIYIIIVFLYISEQYIVPEGFQWCYWRRPWFPKKRKSQTSWVRPNRTSAYKIFGFVQVNISVQNSDH